MKSYLTQGYLEFEAGLKNENISVFLENNIKYIRWTAHFNEKIVSIYGEVRPTFGLWISM